jgi:hypothetical protein
LLLCHAILVPSNVIHVVRDSPSPESLSCPDSVGLLKKISPFSPALCAGGIAVRLHTRPAIQPSPDQDRFDHECAEVGPLQPSEVVGGMGLGVGAGDLDEWGVRFFMHGVLLETVAEAGRPKKKPFDDAHPRRASPTSPKEIRRHEEPFCRLAAAYQPRQAPELRGSQERKGPNRVLDTPSSYNYHTTTPLSIQ